MAFSRIIVIVAANLLVAATAYVSTDRMKYAGQESMSPETAMGRDLWRSHGCANCHSVYGLGGHMGPDLTNVISRRGAAFARAFITAGGGGMPAQALDEAQLDRLIAYLEHLDETGLYPVKSFPDGAYGKARSTPRDGGG